MTRTGSSWEGTPIEITCLALARKFWLTCSIDVWVADRRVLRTGGQWQAVGKQTAVFQHGGREHVAELGWGEYADGAFPVTLSIDGRVIHRGAVAIENSGQAKLGCLLTVLLIVALLVRGVTWLFG